MRKFFQPLLAFVVAFFAFAALAQSAVKITAVDPTTGPSGVVRNVIVDNQGRLVVVSTSSITDAGTTVLTPTTIGMCTYARNSNYTLAANTIQTVGVVTGPNGGWVRVCNSLRNAGSPLVSCIESSGGFDVPGTAANSRGEVLAPGDCVTYPLVALSTGVQCISDVVMNITTQVCSN